MQSIYLSGSEEVGRAGSAMRSAADTMSSAASTIDGAVNQFQRVFYDNLQQLQTMIEEANKIAVANDRVREAWSHLKVANSQSIASDDQTIMGHVRTAIGLLDPVVNEMPPAPPAPKAPTCSKSDWCDAPKDHEGPCNENGLPF